MCSDLFARKPHCKYQFVCDLCVVSFLHLDLLLTSPTCNYLFLHDLYMIPGWVNMCVVTFLHLHYNYPYHLVAINLCMIHAWDLFVCSVLFVSTTTIVPITLQLPICVWIVCRVNLCMVTFGTYTYLVTSIFPC